MSTTYYNQHAGGGHVRRGDATWGDHEARGVFRPMGATLDRQASAIGGTLRAFGLRLPRPSLERARACAVPERCSCPGPYLGELHRKLDAPTKAEVAFRVRNHSSRSRSYAFSVSAMKSETGNAGGAVSIIPSTLILDPGEVAMVRVLVDAGAHEVGTTYASRVKVCAEGCETQTLSIAVTVQRPEDDAPLIDLHCCCHPRMRPLRWYHHYYCDPPEHPANGPGGTVPDGVVKPADGSASA